MRQMAKHKKRNPDPGPVPQDAIDYIEAKDLKPGFSYLDVWGEEHQTAFTVAKIMRYDVLRDVQTSIITALKEGTTYRDWVKTVAPMLDSAGWSAYNTNKPRPARLNVIYDTNMRQARAVGQWQRIQRTKDLRPYIRYSLGPSQRHRPEHVSWAGTTLPVDDPFWESHTPILGYLCFLPGTKISGEIVGASKSLYLGGAVEIELEGGTQLRVTDNHPIATKRGWVKASEIEAGDQCLRNSNISELDTSSVESMFNALSDKSCYRVVKHSPEDFHGEAAKFIGGSMLTGTYTQDWVEEQGLSKDSPRIEVSEILETIKNGCFEEVAAVSRAPYWGYVYDLESKSGWLYADSIVSKNCKCFLTQESERQADRHGGVTERPVDTYEDFKNPRTGKIERVPKGVDPGFLRNPGADRSKILQRIEKQAQAQQQTGQKEMNDKIKG